MSTSRQIRRNAAHAAAQTVNPSTQDVSNHTLGATTLGHGTQTNTVVPLDTQEEDDDETEEISGEDGEEEDDGLEEEDEEEIEEFVAPPSPSLREISSLASWTVSTYKPGCGVKELLSPNNMQFWQSDGPQPHLLTIHFFKVVSIVRMRIYLNQELDESYTPTRMIFAAGMGEHDLVEFAEWKGEDPRGWVEVDLDGVGGRDSGRGYGGFMDDGDTEEQNVGRTGGQDDGKVLRCMCIQIRILENHQNGKDTHIRGVELYARDEKLKRTAQRLIPVTAGKVEENTPLARLEELGGMSDALLEPEWATDFEIR